MKNHRSLPPLPSPLSLENITAYLRDCGCRVTGARTSILRVLMESKSPLSLEEIRDLAKQLGSCSKPDYATVFRTVTQLQEFNLVAKVPVGKSVSYFELRDPKKHYDHLVCRECGKILLLEIPCPVSKTERMLAEQFGFSELSHSLEFFGRCPDCPPPGGRPDPLVPSA